MFRKLKGPDVRTVVMKCAPESCDIHVVSKQRVITKSASPSSVCGRLCKVFVLLLIVDSVGNVLNFLVLLTGCVMEEKIGEVPEKLMSG